ncbi:Leucyl/phenylalanyl-tRNA--protein transferase [Planktothrix tepida]|uniref:Leucyl/phenylalanyl-tRNA--protein transferase n=1 Tax=Planktothrix tepida PCC 9214 TaxID=671072 RepID=A0A1J1LQZ3_9CYAN|nr:leucyl/phenylalanyl-tRNA--protein transferase [Planktothrix tepida]CAD5959526.1 Leucyl/phenylalanyl-tRNA--protein transferase [Planktothrix tepida]CUR34646.1 Leucyl/phenylalanyl-tRNA--protein transferase [Planktothrix tepida PCC 9214]
MQYDVTAIIQGYAQGYFLMANDGEDSLGWYSSRERALIPLNEQFRYPRSLQRVLNQNRFTVAINQDFNAVVEGCANREETWISSELKQIYHALNQAGFAYSFETWKEGELAGGILGIVIGGAFIGESMFFNIPDGSKVAMVKLVERLIERKFILFDAQMNNPHLERFGSYIIKNQDYKKLLKKAIIQPCSF